MILVPVWGMKYLLFRLVWLPSMFNSQLNLLSTNWLFKALALVRGTLNDVDPPMNGVKAAELRPPKDGIDGIDMVGTRGAGVEV